MDSAAVRPRGAAARKHDFESNVSWGSAFYKSRALQRCALPSRREIFSHAVFAGSCLAPILTRWLRVYVAGGLCAAKGATYPGTPPTLENLPWLTPENLRDFSPEVCAAAAIA